MHKNQNERAERILDIFNIMINVPYKDRAVKLDDLCKETPSLVVDRSEIEFLLKADDQNRMDPLLNYTIAHYRIESLIEAGGMGTVYKGENLKLQSPVAIKTLNIPFEKQGQLRAVDRFKQEAEAAAGLVHDNIGQVYDIIEDSNGRIFIIMAYYVGETIKRKLEKGVFSVIDALGYCIQIANGLEESHSNDIIHRDIKPSNILITKNDVVKIIDFGLAKNANNSVDLTQPGQVFGTPAYVSPEQASGRADVDFKTDIWSLGVTLYEMISGRKPFKGPNILEEIQHSKPDLEILEQRERGRELHDLISTCLQKDPQRRYLNMEELKNNLGRVRKRLLTDQSRKSEKGASQYYDSDLLGRDSNEDTIQTLISTANVELTWNGGLDDFSGVKQEELLKILALLLNTEDELRITRVRKGSVKFTIELPMHLAEKLVLAVNGKELEEHGLVNAEITSSKNLAQKLDEIIDHASDLTGIDLEIYLDKMFAGDSHLRQRVIALLHGLEASVPTSFIEEMHSDPIKKRDTIGDYQVVEQLGEGGLGTVYLAERSDDQFNRKVAIKVLRADIGSPEMLKLFQLECQVLTNLRHLNIAQLLYGDVTKDGLPYLVMEYVEGIPITEYCDQHKFPIHERLQLFKTVCDAVGYAHRNLVVHRNLKPSNILITQQGEVKVLDFGITKLFEHSRGSITIGIIKKVTQIIIPYTPAYASPEQVMGESENAAADVYAMGMILYELLTGRQPYQFQLRGLTPDNLELITEDVPLIPSQVVTHKFINENSNVPTELSAKRGISAPKHRRLLKGNLDAIIMKAVKKEPELRYPSASELWFDVNSHLEGKPVMAKEKTSIVQAKELIDKLLPGFIKGNVSLKTLFLLIILASLIVAIVRYAL